MVCIDKKKVEGFSPLLAQFKRVSFQRYDYVLRSEPLDIPPEDFVDAASGVLHKRVIIGLLILRILIAAKWINAIQLRAIFAL